MDEPARAGEEFRGQADAAARRLPADELRALTTLDDRCSALAVAQTVLSTAVTIGVAVAIDHWAVTLVAVVLVAMQQHAMFVLAHDAAHYRLFASRTLNDAVGRAIASSAGISMCTYRVIHRLHHNHLYGKLDPDVALAGGYPRGRAYLLKKLATDLSGLTAVKTYAYFLGAPSRNDDTARALRPLDDTSPSLRAAALRDRNGMIALQGAIPVVLFAGGGVAWLQWWLLLWVLPALTVLQAILRLRAVFEHGAPLDASATLTAARTTLAGPIARLAMFPHHVNHHVEHHLYPAVPHYRLPALHRALRRHGLLDGADVRGWRDTWRRVYAPRAARPAAPIITSQDSA